MYVDENVDESVDVSWQGGGGVCGQKQEFFLGFLVTRDARVAKGKALGKKGEGRGGREGEKAPTGKTFFFTPGSRIFFF